MSILDLLSRKDVWLKFYEYKQSIVSSEAFLDDLKNFIDDEKYLPVCDAITEGKAFPLPKKAIISKLGSEKKRIVYTYPPDENMVLKLLTWLLIRNFDHSFSPNLFSFRPGRTPKDAVRRLIKTDGINEMFSYKADVHDYFNSIPVEKLLPMLKAKLGEDTPLFRFLSSLLSEPYVFDRGKVIAEKKGIMAGTPLSAFFANLFLSELDFHFYEKGAVYARYSDDIIVFSKSEAELLHHIEHIKHHLDSLSLEINPKKETRTIPGEPFTFLGFLISPDGVDIAPVTMKKLKGKMRRKRDALARWAKRKGLSGEKAAKAFIRIFNSKLFENDGDNELCWSEWFFPIINTTESLHQIDLYAQDCIRYLVSGRHTKSRFNVRYDDIKALGYRNLVHEFYSRNTNTDSNEEKGNEN